MRATTSAIYLFINNLLGLGVGTFALGLLSDRLTARFGDDALRYASLAGTVFYLMAALFLWLASRWLREDWDD